MLLFLALLFFGVTSKAVIQESYIIDKILNKQEVLQEEWDEFANQNWTYINYMKFMESTKFDVDEKTIGKLKLYNFTILGALIFTGNIEVLEKIKNKTLTNNNSFNETYNVAYPVVRSKKYKIGFTATEFAKVLGNNKRLIKIFKKESDAYAYTHPERIGISAPGKSDMSAEDLQYLNGREFIMKLKIRNTNNRLFKLIEANR